MDAFFHTLSRQRLFPEAMLRICPGYRPADGDESVARARRVKRRPREQSAESPLAVRRVAEFPKGAAAPYPHYTRHSLLSSPFTSSLRFSPAGNDTFSAFHAGR